MNNEPKFSELKKGDKAEIIGYNTGDSQYKSKLLSMGLVRGVVLQVLQVAPLGDPVEVGGSDAYRERDFHDCDCG